ncbi:hypothetical protein [Gemmata sp.]|uniref:hypothetical protein n=1 Tax=Gemmata sp. TaxID=1914242 RepID=UPI003F6F68D9
MTPEAKARQLIDRRLTQAGWAVQDFAAMSIGAARGVAVREFPLKTGFADYLLFADARAIGVVEAKPEGHTLTGVETQSEKYTVGLPNGLPSHRLPLTFSYESTGRTTRFTSHADPHPRSREVFTFHRSEELLRVVGLDEQRRARLCAIPAVNTLGMWPPQVETVRSLEASLAANRPRSLTFAVRSDEVLPRCNRTGESAPYPSCTFPLLLAHQPFTEPVFRCHRGVLCRGRCSPDLFRRSYSVRQRRRGLTRPRTRPSGTSRS